MKSPHQAVMAHQENRESPNLRVNMVLLQNVALFEKKGSPLRAGPQRIRPGKNRGILINFTDLLEQQGRHQRLQKHGSLLH